MGLVALASGDARLWRDDRADPLRIPAAALDYGFTLAITLAIVGALAVLATLFVVPKVPVAILAESRRLLLGMAAVIVVCGILFAVAQGVPRFERRDQNGAAQPVGPRATELKPRRETKRDPPEFKWELVAVLAGATAAAGAGAYVVHRRRRTDSALEPTAEEDLADDLSGALEDALADLEAERDPRRAVIRAYAGMERVLARHGTPRWPFEAPFEYLSRILRELRVRADAALALTELFERAKFSRHEIDPSMKEEAIAAFVAVRDDLRATA